ncbi:MAG: 16S rRNA (adenine(1518)-N(6)/adenine(1519)-N(6))-dimethyltransferase RsmA [Bacillota bacterium]
MTEPTDHLPRPESARDIAALLERRRFSFNHRLGQNFLLDPKVLVEIAKEAGVGPGDHILEVGAGAGMLTVELARRAAAVAAVELDRRLLDVLAQVLAGLGNVTVIHGDILKTDPDEVFADLAEKAGAPAGVRRVVANLPYYITSPVIMKFLEEAPASRLPWTTMTVTIQREVADRLLAVPGGKEYGAITLAVNYYAQVRGGRVIPPGAFRPAPKVSSRVVTFVRRERPPVEADRGLLFKLVRAGFGQRRKTIANALSALNKGDGGSAPAWSEVLREAGIDPRRRAETLSLEEFAALTQVVERLHMVER